MIYKYSSQNQERGLKKLQKGFPIPIDGDKATFLTNLYNWSKKKINKGINQIKSGNYVKGAANVSLGTGGIYIWGSCLIDILWPEGLWPKTK